MKQKKIDSRKNVYLLWHVSKVSSVDTEELFVGVFEKLVDAKNAAKILKLKPGFKKYPRGFKIFKHKIGEIGWKFGFKTYKY